MGIRRRRIDGRSGPGPPHPAGTARPHPLRLRRRSREFTYFTQLTRKLANTPGPPLFVDSSSSAPRAVGAASLDPDLRRGCTGRPSGRGRSGARRSDRDLRVLARAPGRCTRGRGASRDSLGLRVAGSAVPPSLARTPRHPAIGPRLGSTFVSFLPARTRRSRGPSGTRRCPGSPSPGSDAGPSVRSRSGRRAGAPRWRTPAPSSTVAGSSRPPRSAPRGTGGTTGFGRPPRPWGSDRSRTRPPPRARRLAGPFERTVPRSRSGPSAGAIGSPGGPEGGRRARRHRTGGAGGVRRADRATDGAESSGPPVYASGREGTSNRSRRDRPSRNPTGPAPGPTPALHSTKGGKPTAPPGPGGISLYGPGPSRTGPRSDDAHETSARSARGVESGEVDRDQLDVGHLFHGVPQPLPSDPALLHPPNGSASHRRFVGSLRWTPPARIRFARWNARRRSFV